MSDRRWTIEREGSGCYLMCGMGRSGCRWTTQTAWTGCRSKTSTTASGCRSRTAKEASGRPSGGRVCIESRCGPAGAFGFLPTEGEEEEG